MALFTCTRCGRRISDAAPSCIHCGLARAANLAAAAAMAGAAAGPSDADGRWASAAEPQAYAPPAPAYPAHWDAPVTVVRRPQSFGDHWWRGKIYVSLIYATAALALIAGALMFFDPESSLVQAGLFCAAGGIAGWLAYAVAGFRRLGYWVAMVILGVVMLAAVVESFMAKDMVGAEGATASVLLYMIFAAYFYERRADFVN